MTLTIEEIEQQIAHLNEHLNRLKNPKLQVSRNFTGQYFEPYQGRMHRRMESDGVPIWESYLDIKTEWVQVDNREGTQLEKIYQQDCVVKEEPIAGIIEASME
jgi:hypothetical protein